MLAPGTLTIRDAAVGMYGMLAPGMQGVLAAGIQAPVDTALQIQGLLLPEDPCVWDVGDRSTRGGNTLGASSQEMPKQGCAGVLQHLG